jgi:hypothetical protein
MSPRAGGEAEKFGNRYEGAWTTRQLLEVLAGNAESVQVEPFGDEGQGVEFIVRRSTHVEAHQVKRQRGQQNGWTISALARENVLADAATHIDSGRQFHFVSTIPARDLGELSDRARRSDDVKRFVDGQLDGKRLRSEFDVLCGVWGSPERTWHLLRNFYPSWPDERELRSSNAALASLLVSGASGPTVTATLADLIAENIGVTLNAATLRDRLVHYGLGPGLTGAPSVAEAVAASTQRWLASVEAELLRPVIARAEVQLVVDALDTGTKLLLAVGAAGAGKSGVLHQVVTGLQTREWPILAARLDRVDAFTTADQLAERLGVPASPVSALAAVADGRDCLLVIDQLDAISFTSGRMPWAFDGVAEILRQAGAFPNMRVLLACRRFDLDNDPRFRGLVSDNAASLLVEVNPLTDTEVSGALAAMGLDSTQMSESQRTLLRMPLSLVLLKAIAEDGSGVEFRTTIDLFDSFWDRKRREVQEHAGRDIRFEDVIDRVVTEMSMRQRLAVPAAVLDADGLQADADGLRSAHVLVQDRRLLAFFHEAFFDYAFARRWTARGESLVGFLLDGFQELFRRAQVRQVLLHLRNEDPDRFRREVEELLVDDRIRFHIKDVAIAILMAIPDPEAADWGMVERVLDSSPAFAERLWSALRTEPWFVLLDGLGVLDAWLRSDQADRHARALEVMASATGPHPDRIAGLLEPLQDRVEFGDWFRWLGTWLPFAENRKLFDLLLASVRRGEWSAHGHHLWLAANELEEKEPDWGGELAAAWLLERPDALAVTNGRVAALESDDHGLMEIVRAAAAASPRNFVERLLPFMLEAMSATQVSGERQPRRDAHFTYRVWHGDRYTLADVLLFQMASALQELARNHPDVAEPYLETLARDSHDAAQWLLYHALAANPGRYAAWAAQILLEGEHRFYSGYMCDSFWTTRELLLAVSPCMTEDALLRMESAILEFYPEWEQAASGYSQFKLLTALPEDQMTGRARDRLVELRRTFDVEQPQEPQGIISGFVGPPVSSHETDLMTDDQWFDVIIRYSGERESFEGLVGGAHEQAQVLGQAAERDPERFARFGLRLTAEHHPAYLGAILRALGQTGEAFDPEYVFALVRHAANLQMPAVALDMSWAVRKTYDTQVPEDVIRIVLAQALTAQDPDREVWREVATSGQQYYSGDPFHAGMNSTRGTAALTLGDLLVYDVDGSRTALVAESLEHLAADPILAVRTCVARVIAASLRHAPDLAVSAFRTLTAADDELLATDPVEQLTAYVGFRDAALARLVVERMLSSASPDVRMAGGRLSAFLGLEQDAADLLEGALISEHAEVRAGAAIVCAQRLAYARDAEAAERALRILFDDPSLEVRTAAARVAVALRERDINTYHELLLALINSETFPEARTQLLIALRQSASPLGDLALPFAERFLEVHTGDIANLSTRAGGDARDVAELLMRAYAQTDDPADRARTLDLLDALLLAGAWRVADVVEGSER